MVQNLFLENLAESRDLAVESGEKNEAGIYLRLILLKLVKNFRFDLELTVDSSGD